MFEKYNLDKVELCPEFTGSRKITAIQMTLLWQILKSDTSCPSIEVIRTLQYEYQESVRVTIRQVNRLRVKWGFSRNKGRPNRTSHQVADTEPIQRHSHISYVGVHLFAAWVENEGSLMQVVSGLEDAIAQYKEAHPTASFPLLFHRRETLEKRVQSLLYLPLMGIGKLTELDRCEHALESVVGKCYQSSTLIQFLGQLERIDASKAMMPTLIPEFPGSLCYVDGHMIAFWTTQPMHKGKITMLGRIMPGSQAFIAHNEAGEALFVDYQPPDMRLPNVVEDYCKHIVETTEISTFVIDREINSVDIARCFEKHEWGLMSRLDSNEYKTIADFETKLIGTLDESQVYTGQWKALRSDDPRHFVLLENSERLLVFWGTTKVANSLSPLSWPSIYRQRNEIQENQFKRMKSHGMLDVNYGIKKIWGEDRHQKRAVDKLDEQIQAVSSKQEQKEQLLLEQREKVTQSQTQGHGKRLEQRQQRLGKLEKEINLLEQKSQNLSIQRDKLGQPSVRADRDFRKQSIMTYRTLKLENLLMSFFAILFPDTLNICLESLLELFFERTGTFIETQTQIMIWINPTGLSKMYRILLTHIVEGLNKMGLLQSGKPIQVRLKEAPT